MEKHKCKFCGGSMANLCHHNNEVINLHCPCGAHYFKGTNISPEGKWYTKEEWYEMINS